MTDPGAALCLSWHQGYRCLRPAGHKGKHRHSGRDEDRIVGLPPKDAAPTPPPAPLREALEALYRAAGRIHAGGSTADLDEFQQAIIEAGKALAAPVAEGQGTISGVITESHMEGEVRVIDGMRLTGVALAAAAPAPAGEGLREPLRPHIGHLLGALTTGELVCEQCEVEIITHHYMGDDCTEEDGDHFAAIERGLPAQAGSGGLDVERLKAALRIVAEKAYPNVHDVTTWVSILLLPQHNDALIAAYAAGEGEG